MKNEDILINKLGNSFASFANYFNKNNKVVENFNNYDDFDDEDSHYVLDGLDGGIISRINADMIILKNCSNVTFQKITCKYLLLVNNTKLTFNALNTGEAFVMNNNGIIFNLIHCIKFIGVDKLIMITSGYIETCYGIFNTFESDNPLKFDKAIVASNTAINNATMVNEKDVNINKFTTFYDSTISKFGDGDILTIDSSVNTTMCSEPTDVNDHKAVDSYEKMMINRDIIKARNTFRNNLKQGVFNIGDLYDIYTKPYINSANRQLTRIIENNLANETENDENENEEIEVKSDKNLFDKLKDFISGNKNDEDNDTEVNTDRKSAEEIVFDGASLSEVNTDADTETKTNTKSNVKTISFDTATSTSIPEPIPQS